MPGGALTANTMMMRDTQTLHLYGDVIKEMTEVVRLGGFGSSVTPVSQFYFQQAYLNVTLGRWKRINPNYGNMVLGYFGKTPVEPDAKLVALASEQLGKPVFKDDPLDALEPGIPKATKLLEENGIPVNDENIFIVASCEAKGVDFLLGKGKSTVRKKQKEEEAIKIQVSKTQDDASGQNIYSLSFKNADYNLVVAKGNKGAVQTPNLVSSNPNPPVEKQTFAVAPPTSNQSVPSEPVQNRSEGANGIEVKAQIPGKILRVSVSVGDQVAEHQSLLIMEAMKMETDVTSPKEGTVKEIHVKQDDAVQTDDLLVVLE